MAEPPLGSPGLRGRVPRRWLPNRGFATVRLLRVGLEERSDGHFSRAAGGAGGGAALSPSRSHPPTAPGAGTASTVNGPDTRALLRSTRLVVQRLLRRRLILGDRFSVTCGRSCTEAAAHAFVSALTRSSRTAVIRRCFANDRNTDVSHVINEAHCRRRKPSSQIRTWINDEVTGAVAQHAAGHLWRRLQHRLCLLRSWL
jgi:hypothetical protein